MRYYIYFCMFTNVARKRNRITRFIIEMKIKYYKLIIFITLNLIKFKL